MKAACRSTCGDQSPYPDVEQHVASVQDRGTYATSYPGIALESFREVLQDLVRWVRRRSTTHTTASGDTTPQSGDQQ